MAPSKHKVLTFGLVQGTVSLVLQTSHAGHLHRDWVHTICVTDPGGRGVGVGRCQKSPQEPEASGHACRAAEGRRKQVSVFKAATDTK